MDKILEIASSIKNPISLTALFFIILYLLYKGIIAKIGTQEGERGYQLLKRLMSIVGIVAIVTLVGVFGLKAYQVYSKVDEIPDLKDLQGKLNENTNELAKTNENIADLSKAKLEVEYQLSELIGGDLQIGNIGNNIIIVENLKIHWESSKCTEFRQPNMASVMAEYRYEVNITQGSGNKTIDTKKFKYGAGDVDQFLVEITYPGLGVYNVWFSFEYKVFGTKDWVVYKTKKENIENCAKFN